MVSVWSILGCSRFMLYQFTTYFQIIFGITILSLLQMTCVTIPPPQKYLGWQFARFSLATSYLYFRWYLYIIWYIYENLSLSYLLTHYILDKYSVVMFLSVFPEFINGIMFKASAISLLKSSIKLEYESKASWTIIIFRFHEVFLFYASPSKFDFGRI